MVVGIAIAGGSQESLVKVCMDSVHSEDASESGGRKEQELESETFRPKNSRNTERVLIENLSRDAILTNFPLDHMDVAIWPVALHKSVFGTLADPSSAVQRDIRPDENRSQLSTVG